MPPAVSGDIGMIPDPMPPIIPPGPDVPGMEAAGSVPRILRSIVEPGRGTKPGGIASTDVGGIIPAPPTPEISPGGIVNMSPPFGRRV